MRHAVAFVVVVGALLVVPAAEGAPPSPGVTHVSVPAGTPPVDWGRQLFGANCVTCHAPGGRGIFTPVQGAGGTTGLGPSLQGVGAQAADFYLRTGYMPLQDPDAQPRRSRVLFSQRELQALVAYVASLKPGPPVPTPHPERGNLAEGLQQYTEHCAGCHQVSTAGGYVTNAVAPRLNDSTPVQIAEAARIGPYLMPRFSERQISNSQLDSLIRYVIYARHPDDRGGWALGHVGPVPEGLVTWFIGAAVLVATCLVIGRRLRA
jgi:ubiquinol-cytochrome c reductase cytochrome c subunit